MITLRQDQQDCIDNLRAAIGEGHRRIVVQGATGYGKTLVMSEIVQNALNKGKKILVTVPKIWLVDQTYSAFMRQGIYDMGVIQADHPRTDWSKPVQIASVQTLLRQKFMPTG